MRIRGYGLSNLNNAKSQKKKTKLKFSEVKRYG
nr:MAG TPA: hypothetical protein [Bacteriophage sp.]